MAAATIARRVLLIERVGGQLLALNDYFQQHAIEVMRAPDVRSASGLAKDMRRISAMVINPESVRGDVPALVHQIKEQHPDLPILWFADANTAVAAPRKVEVFGPDPKQLEAALAAALHDEVYSNAFVSRVTALCSSTLHECLLPSTPAAAYLKASTASMSEVNAYINLAGRHVSGHVLLCSTFSDLRRTYSQVFPRETLSPGIDDLEDHLGEAVNRVLGRLKRVVDRDEDCVVGVPYFIRGAACLRHKSGSPSLAIEFSNGSERLQLELCFYRFDNWALTALKNAAPDEDEVEAGELKLL